MTEEQKPTEQEQEATTSGSSAETQNTDTSQGSGTGPDPVPYARFKEVNDKLNALISTQQAAEAEAEKARIAKLAQDGELQALIDELTPRAERAKTLEGVVKTLLKAKLESVPEDKRSLVPDGVPEQQLAWLGKAEAAGLFSKPAGPNTHAGSGTGGGALAGKAGQDERAAEVLKRFNLKPGSTDWMRD